ncbi:MAG: hypothetical protein PHW82_03215 [Bacteroidales bacterium]|nr:hypothetical protein [Bacteroidales bacterium]
MVINTPEEHIYFLENSVLIPIRKVLDSHETVFGFMLMGQAIEILGSYLDNKPIRAKQQSASRFSLAIYKLFPPKYAKINKNNTLYIQLRACLTHTFIPSGNVSLNFGLDEKEKHHLKLENDVLYIYSENLYSDLVRAIKKLITNIQLCKVRLKKLSIGEINPNQTPQV